MFGIVKMFVEFKKVAQNNRARVEAKGGFERFDGFLAFTELFESLGIGNIAGRLVALELNGLTESHGGFFVLTSFEIDETDIMNTGSIGIKALCNFKTLDCFFEVAFFGIEDAETIIGGGIFFIKFKDSQECLLGLDGFMFFYGVLGEAPEFFHLGSFGGSIVVGVCAALIICDIKNHEEAEA